MKNISTKDTLVPKDKYVAVFMTQTGLDKLRAWPCLSRLGDKEVLESSEVVDGAHYLAMTVDLAGTDAQISVPHSDVLYYMSGPSDTIRKIGFGK